MWQRPFAFACAGAAAVLSTTPAYAGSVTILVTGPNGRPLADAVVSIDVPGGAKPVLHGPYIMAQRNIAFDPHILIVPAGAMVLFPNKDQVRHHVYSFSAIKKFEIKLYGRDETKSIRFEKAGIVSLGCNIHDSMSGFIFVTATPYAAITDAAGQVKFADVPSGQQLLTVWAPAIRAANNTESRPIRVGAEGLQTTFSVK